MTENVIANLRQQTVPADILVVDNGSRDRTVEMVRGLGVQVLEMGHNRGFAAAVNEGIRAAAGEWILILNNDVELDPRWIERSLEAAAEENAAFVTGKLLQARQPERIDGTWDLLSRAGCAWRCGFDSLDGPSWNKRRTIRMTSLTAALFHRSVFEAVGYLDPQYISYYEDVDFALRVSLAGFKGIYEPGCVGRHWGSATLGVGPQTTYLISRNQFLLAAKFGLSALGWWNLLLGQSLFVLSAARQGHLLQALAGKWTGLQTACKLQQPVEANRKALAALLNETEAELERYQQELGPDTTWRLYFRWSTRRQ